MVIKTSHRISLSESQLPLMEQFYSLQGEGFHSGRAAYFLRLAGCDVGCSWCDVKESWDVEENQILEISTLVDQVIRSKCGFCVVTGGEPALYNLQKLTASLRKNNIYCAIETSGSSEITGDWHWICLSPKKFKPALSESYQKANELKIIVFNKHDLIWAEEQANKVNKDCLLFLQPEWSKAEQLLPEIISYIKQNPKWKLSLQIHKYLQIP